MTYKNGGVYDGEWDKDKFNGQGVIYDNNGNIFQNGDGKNAIWENVSFVKIKLENIIVKTNIPNHLHL